MSSTTSPVSYSINSQTLSSRSAALAIMACILVSGCSSRQQQSNSYFPSDYRERHPIALTDAKQSLEIYATKAHGLDDRQRSDLSMFAADYRKNARSGVTVEVPVDSRGNVPNNVKNTVNVVRHALVSGGVRTNAIKPQYYHDQTNGSMPVKLSFFKFKAKVQTECGTWPEDLAGADSVKSWENRPYWNLGCAYQNAFAQQVADPLDLVRGRAEGAADSVKRMTAVEKLRKGEDPSTEYKNRGYEIQVKNTN